MFYKKIKEPLTIFLDVDGVLNKESDWINPFTLNDSCVKVFNELWRELSKHYVPQLVLISTWRSGKGNLGNSEAYQRLENALEKYGIRISGTTPISNKGRQNEVEYYIRRNTVDKYIVIDDDEKLFERPSEINWYQPNYKIGLTNDDVKKIIRVIKDK